MKMAIAIGSFLVLGTGAASVGAALPNPYKGSDTLFNLTNQAIAEQGSITGTYAGGGSGGGETAMVAGTQATAPMSRMLGSGACGTAALDKTKAAGLVIALDGVGVWGDAAGAAGAVCNSSGGGLLHDATATGWKHVLQVLYMGEAVAGSGVVCNGPARTALVANWSNLFNVGATCTEPAGCATALGSSELLHAYRRDDVSGTSDVFSQVVGIPSGSPSVSVGSANKFGATPYCNAVNWDQSTGNANCALGVASQYVGPGGLPIAGNLTHRTPPAGAWGDTSANAPGTQPYVSPTSYQDNDPIRRPCQGSGNGNPGRPGEQVCNTDGNLGVVLPIPPPDFIATATPAGDPFPVGTAGCNGIAAAGLCSGAALLGAGPVTFTCAIRGTGTFRPAPCANNDTQFGGQCYIPTSASGSVVCEAIKATAAPLCGGGVGCGADGRQYNLHMHNPNAANAYYTNITTPGGTLLPFTGHYGRIHMTQTMPTALGATNGCEMLDATDQIGCLAHADQCSLGYAGLGAGSWNTRAACTPASANNGTLLVNNVLASTSTVQAFGGPTAYPLSRKLYDNSIPGFAAASVTSDELALANYENTHAAALATANGFITLGPQSPAGVDKPFCEDFNEFAVCASGAANVDGCAAMPASLPGAAAQTICGNGVKEAYEECDCSDGVDGSPSTDPNCTAAGANGLKNGAAPNFCSLTCRKN